MDQNDTSISVYKAGAVVVLDAFRNYFTCMERLREVQRRTDGDGALDSYGTSSPLAFSRRGSQIARPIGLMQINR